jgi:photosystem II stability/assembly factor-like uncharacterized protein
MFPMSFPRSSAHNVIGGSIFSAYLLILSALPAGAGWIALPNAPAGGNWQDVYFVDPELGWVVNGSGQIHRTTDGGESWNLQADEPFYLRCVGFADALTGWVGNLDGVPLLYATTDGGANWTPVFNIPEPLPTGICGIWVVNRDVIYGCGKYNGTSARVIKSTDGGLSWTSMDLNPLADSLVDCYFFDEENGFVVGGVGATQNTRRAVILATTDGGTTWTTRHTTDRQGEWCWKVSFPSPSVGYVSIESFGGSTYFLKTIDSGQTWQDLFFRNNYIVQGIGFATPSLGWIGGPTGPTYESTDGGASWSLAGFGVHINRFRFLSQSLGYAVGSTVYKYTSTIGISTATPAPPLEIALAQNRPNPFRGSTTIAYTLAGPAHVKMTIIDAMGRNVRTLLDGSQPRGAHELHWDVRDSGGNPVPGGVYWYRLEAGAEIAAQKLLVVR